MAAGALAKKLGYEISQFVLDGVYITEDYINRKPSFDGKIKPIDRKKEFWEAANAIGQHEVTKLATKLIKNQSNP
jgi:hypothetical protein